MSVLPRRYAMVAMGSGFSAAQEYVQDDAGGNGHQNVVAAGLHPVIAPRRSPEFVAAPVIDDVVSMAVFDRQAIATVKGVIGTGTAPFAALVAPVMGALVLPHLLAAAAVAPVIAPALVVPAAPVPVSAAISLSESDSALGQGHRHHGGNNCSGLHDVLQFVENASTHVRRLAAEHASPVD